jgi:hypothetical protein
MGTQEIDDISEKIAAGPANPTGRSGDQQIGPDHDLHQRGAIKRCAIIINTKDYATVIPLSPDEQSQLAQISHVSEALSGDYFPSSWMVVLLVPRVMIGASYMGTRGSLPARYFMMRPNVLITVLVKDTRSLHAYQQNMKCMRM